MGYSFSRYSYNRVRSQQYTHAVTVNTENVNLADPAIGQRIQNVLSKSGLNDWEKNFLNSIGEFFGKKLRLSHGQYYHLVKIESKFSDEKVEAEKSFQDTFTDEMRSDMVLIAKIYDELKSPYFRDIRKHIADNPNYIPTKDVYEKFVCSKYAVGYLANAKAKPKFAVGDTVVPSSQYQEDYLTKRFTAAIIIDNDSVLPASHAKGAKRYIILPYGETNTKIVEERELKFHKA